MCDNCKSTKPHPTNCSFGRTHKLCYECGKLVTRVDLKGFEKREWLNNEFLQVIFYGEDAPFLFDVAFLDKHIPVGLDKREERPKVVKRFMHLSSELLNSCLVCKRFYLGERDKFQKTKHAKDVNTLFNVIKKQNDQYLERI